MLLPNCLFRMGAAAMILSNSASEARFRLRRVVRTVTAARDADYRCVFQEEDDKGNTGIRLSKDLATTAGYALKKRFLDNDITEEEAVFDVLGRAVLVLSHAAARAMRERGHGAIVNVSSVAGQITSGTYSAVKSFVTVFTEGLASELAGTGVTATALLPGFTRTEFHQRMDVSRRSAPGWMWLDADRVVRDALADLDAGKALSVPSRRYRVLAAVARTTPVSVQQRFQSLGRR